MVVLVDRLLILIDLLNLSQSVSVGVLTFVEDGLQALGPRQHTLLLSDLLLDVGWRSASGSDYLVHTALVVVQVAHRFLVYLHGVYNKMSADSIKKTNQPKCVLAN